MSTFDDESTEIAPLVDTISTFRGGIDEVVHNERRRQRKKQRIDRKRRERATRWSVAFRK